MQRQGRESERWLLSHTAQLQSSKKAEFSGVGVLVPVTINTHVPLIYSTLQFWIPHPGISAWHTGGALEVSAAHLLLSVAASIVHFTCTFSFTITIPILKLRKLRHEIKAC